MKKNNVSLFTNIFDDGFPFFSMKNDNLKLRTDIKETNMEYIFRVDVAGIDKDNIHITVDNGYMVIEIKQEKEECDSNEFYIRRELMNGSCSRIYYIGDIKEDNIKATYQNGLITINVPKEDTQMESKKMIHIE